jgi:uncharacterized membrane protein
MTVLWVVLVILFVICCAFVFPKIGLRIMLKNAAEADPNKPMPKSAKRLPYIMLAVGGSILIFLRFILPLITK